MSQERFLALDLGAESGRGVVGTLSEANHLTLGEVHRFPNGPIRMGDSLHWDLPRLVAECRIAIGKASEGGRLRALGVDTWGVDFGLLGPGGELVGLPFHYRDPRTQGQIEKVFARVPQEEVFASTGIQTMPINTLFQLAALRERSPRVLEAARTLLFMPDLLHYYLTGRAESEYTIASTSQMLNATTRTWATDLLKSLDLPADILPAVLPAGAGYGTLTPTEADLTGAGAVPVIAPGGHDTACAVAAVPAEGSGWAYLSSGTWSLLGVEVPRPILTPEAAAANVTNEGGVGGTIRLLKNIAGLWLVQECRRAYARLGSERTYEQLTRLAAEAPALSHIVDPDHPSLMAPSDMPRAIRELCLQNGQLPPEGVGATIRCCLDSLGLKYRAVLETLERLTGQAIHTLHIVGGGTQNRLLNQIAADATGRHVLAGPIEATATGSVLLQAMAQGRIGSLGELRAIVRASFPVEAYTPDPLARAQWDDAYQAAIASGRLSGA
ncbi:MAG: rhamnulokinase [Cytophagales bacterium]|nr:rhamnulokinase [Armatimonadota bacterium]